MNFDLLCGPWTELASGNQRYWVRDTKENGKLRRLWQHRLIMEMAYGRPLLRSEHVHHRDGDGLNNEPSNLQVLTGSEHTRLHHRQKQDQVERAIARYLFRLDAPKYRKEILGATESRAA